MLFKRMCVDQILARSSSTKPQEMRALADPTSLGKEEEEEEGALLFCYNFPGAFAHFARTLFLLCRAVFKLGGNLADEDGIGTDLFI